MNNKQENLLIRGVVVLLLSLFGMTQAFNSVDDEYRERGLIQLCGEQFSEYKGKFVLTGDLIIPKDSTMTLLPGTKIFCNPNTSIIVHGRLICQYDSSDSVTFIPYKTDKKPSNLWKGIYVYSSGEIVFDHTFIDGTQNGIEVDKGGNIQGVVYHGPSCVTNLGERFKKELSYDLLKINLDTCFTNDKIEIPTREGLSKKTYLSTGLAILLGVSGYLAHEKALHYSKIEQGNDSTYINKAWGNRQRFKTISNLMYSTAFLTGVYASVSFTFDIIRKSEM